MLTVTLYTRKDCHLCEQAKADLESLQAQYPHRVVEIDMQFDPRNAHDNGRIALELSDINFECLSWIRLHLSNSLFHCLHLHA